MRLILYNRYKVLPIVLVFVTKYFLNEDFRREFTSSRNGILLEASREFWAKQCVLLSANAVSNHTNQRALDPMIVPGLFLTYHGLYKTPKHHRSDAALMLLSSTAKEIFLREVLKKIKKLSTFYQLNQAKRIFEEIIEEDDDQVDVITKKTKNCAEKEILAIQQIQKDLEEDDAREESKNVRVYKEPNSSQTCVFVSESYFILLEPQPSLQEQKQIYK